MQEKTNIHCVSQGKEGRETEREVYDMIKKGSGGLEIGKRYLHLFLFLV